MPTSRQSESSEWRCLAALGPHAADIAFRCRQRRRQPPAPPLREVLELALEAVTSRRPARATPLRPRRSMRAGTARSWPARGWER